MDLTGHEDVGISHECNDITQEILPCRFAGVIAGWAVGGNVWH